MIGRIHAVSGREVLIAPRGHTACFGCAKNCPEGRVLISAENQDNLPLSPGQLVEAENSPRGLVSQGLSVILPLFLGFLAGFFFIGIIFPSAGEGARAAGGTFCLFAGGGLMLLIRRRYPAREKNRIIRVIA
jgi:hypothetical protein